MIHQHQLPQTPARAARGACITWLAGAAFIATPALAQDSYDLYGPTPEAGTTYTNTQIVEGSDGEMTIAGNGQEMEMTMETEGRTVTQFEILGLEDDTIVSARTTILENAQDSTVGFGGQEQSQTTGQETVGLVLDHRFNNGRWTTATSGATLPAEILKNFENSGFVDPRVVYPESPVAIGESWQVDPELMQSLAGQAGLGDPEFGGSCTFTLTGVAQRNGRRVAEIDVELDMTMSFLMPGAGPGAGQMNMEMELTGTLYRDLDQHLEDAQDLVGTMSMTMSPTPGQNVEMDIDIHVQTQIEKK